MEPLRSIPKDECCAGCGTDLHWWRNNSPRNKIYWTASDDYFCRVICVREIWGRYQQYSIISDRRKGKKDRRLPNGQDSRTYDKLVEACKEMITWYEERNITMGTPFLILLAEMREAIKKAEGE